MTGVSCWPAWGMYVAVAENWLFCIKITNHTAREGAANSIQRRNARVGLEGKGFAPIHLASFENPYAA